MTLIRIFVNNKEDKDDILEWLLREIVLNGHISLLDVLTKFEDKLLIQDNDVFGYNQVGWNVNDLNRLFGFKTDLEAMEFPYPRIKFEPHYT